MKKSVLFAGVLLLGIMTGCQDVSKAVPAETTAPVSVQEEASEETADEMQAALVESEAAETETEAAETEASEVQKETAEEQTETAENEAVEAKNEAAETQAASLEERGTAFKSLKIEVSEGTINISTGTDFSLSRRSGKDVDYEISGEVLYVRAKRSDEVMLVLPEQDSYEALELVVKNGHAYVEGAVTAESLSLEAEHGEVSLDGIVILKDSSFLVNGGSASFHGDPGAAVSADCRQGHLELAVPFAESECSCEISVSGGNVSLGGHEYHGKSGTYTIENEGGRFFQLNCTHGDLSVGFGK